jgi:acyl-coenzyme A synthetase/AMP-(fatty) acid ligase
MNYFSWQGCVCAHYNAHRSRRRGPELPKAATGKIQRFKLREESTASAASGKAA